MNVEMMLGATETVKRGMSIVRELPPNLEEIRAAGMDPDLSMCIFTHGDIIYSPGGIDLPNYLVEHEKCHSVQQANHPGGVEGWWRQYLEDVSFRLEQEVAAYRVQFQFYCKDHRNPRKQAEFLAAIAQCLSNRCYGEMVNEEDARLLVMGKERI